MSIQTQDRDRPGLRRALSAPAEPDDRFL